MPDQIAPRDVVKFRRIVDPGDEYQRFVVLRVDPPNSLGGAEALVEAIVDMPIPPQYSYPIDDLEVIPRERVRADVEDAKKRLMEWRRSRRAKTWIAKNCRFAQKTSQAPQNRA